MVPGFGFGLADEQLYCSACRVLIRHKRLGEGPVALGCRTAVLCLCRGCGRKSILFASDFRAYRLPEEKEAGWKLPGRSRIVAGDAVLLTDGRRCRVKARYRRGGDETLVLETGEGGECEITPQGSDDGALSPETFKLLPEQAGLAAVGDPVIAAEGRKAGRIVGMAHRPNPGLFVAWENGPITWVARPGCDCVPDRDIYASLRRLFPKETGRPGVRPARYRVENGIVILEGTVRNLREVAALTVACRRVEGVLGVLNEMTVRVRSGADDRSLEDQVLIRLLGTRLPLAMIRVEAPRGRVRIQARCRGAIAEQELAELLDPLPGVRSLACRWEDRLPSGQDGERKAVEVEQALNQIPWLGADWLRVHCLEEGLCLDGLVSSASHKKLASLLAVWAAKDLKIINNLRVADV